MTFLRTVTHRPARLLRFEHEDGIRLAVVLCPWCGEEHRHVYPDDVLAAAPGHRRPGCGHRRPDYAITTPTTKERRAGSARSLKETP